MTSRRGGSIFVSCRGAAFTSAAGGRIRSGSTSASRSCCSSRPSSRSGSRTTRGATGPLPRSSRRCSRRASRCGGCTRCSPASSAQGTMCAGVRAVGRHADLRQLDRVVLRALRDDRVDDATPVRGRRRFRPRQQPRGGSRAGRDAREERARSPSITLVVMLLVRRVVGDRERRAQLAERERDVAAREAVVEERARIARELHDAIAHNVSMMVVQAGAERRTLDHESGATREVLATIEQIGRGALTEMRRLVGMLRSDDGRPARSAARARRSPDARHAGARGRAADRAPRRGRAARAAGRARALRVPDRAGGADERLETRGGRARQRSRHVRPGLARARDRRRRRGRPAAGRPAAGTASSACASASLSTADASTQAALRAAASRSACSSRSDDDRPDRRRPGARPRRPAEDPRERAGHERGRRSRGRRGGSRCRAHRSVPTWC